MEPIPNVEEIDLQKHLLVLQRRWIPFLGIFGIVLSAATLFALSTKPAYKAEASLLIKANRNSLLAELGEKTGRLEPLAVANNPLDTQVRVVESVPVIEDTISSLQLKDSGGKLLTIEDFRKKLKVEASKGTDILSISYTDEDPELAAKVVNTLVDTYIRRNVQANRAEAQAARKFILNQLPTTETSVRVAESALRQFREQNRIIVLQEEANAAVDTISKLEEDISQVQAQLADVTAQSEKLRNQVRLDSQQALVYSELSKIPGIQQLLVQLQEAQSQLAVEQTRYQPGHPSVINLEEKVAALSNLLQQRVQQVSGSNQGIAVKNLQVGDLRQDLIAELLKTEKERTGLEQRITQLSNSWYAYKQRASILPKLEQTQRELERKLKAAQGTYETLLTRLQEINVAENQSVENARKISPALIPEKPSVSKKRLIVGGGAIAGLLLGAIAAFGLDLIDRSVKTVREARELFGYTLLGIIPALNKNSKSKLNSESEGQVAIVNRDVPSFPLGDAYQMLQANLKFLNTDRKLRAIAVTSSVAKEGKSQVSANLAVAMAQVGHRVLLVDADMRRPSQHHIWRQNNIVGLSNMVVDQVALDTTVQKVMPNLDILPAGVVPPNPVALLDSNRMRTLVANFVEHYDFVIFDTPPLAGIVDAAVLGKLVDGILLVVRPGVVDWSSANAAKEFLTQSGQNVLGMVINGVNAKHEPDSYFYYTREQTSSFSLRTSEAQTLMEVIGRKIEDTPPKQNL
jgi:capsular exopolysaccharide synthesis family protein